MGEAGGRREEAVGGLLWYDRSQALFATGSSLHIHFTDGARVQEEFILRTPNAALMQLSFLSVFDISLTFSPFLPRRERVSHYFEFGLGSRGSKTRFGSWCTCFCQNWQIFLLSGFLGNPGLGV